jgi:Restriction endonuclease
MQSTHGGGSRGLVARKVICNSGGRSRPGDGGVDGVINEDRLGLDRVYVQAKRYTAGNAVGRPDVQAFGGSLVGLGARKRVFVTTSTFSAQARDFVKHLSQRVVLLDGASLADLMIEHGIGVRTSRTIEFRRLDEDFFEKPSKTGVSRKGRPSPFLGTTLSQPLILQKCGSIDPLTGTQNPDTAHGLAYGANCSSSGLFQHSSHIVRLRTR